ncbi:excinuclease ABC subunit UvrB [Candidatus Neptunochlamydia vexilliferae]|uniref:UvrABC system protein B n=1 Tax=Candidatus Neptunichlamydia vexilliferae TaxID=1651774 RepID=A0ABS0B2W5_9BACT|nr:excinuclease ABC subunit UvrB [Candidatus Neptunochlamydia vexilliferae]MBF5059905.1 UvrABC system protein B [Candidatus Neptunochlamydia vexilliferae]
MFQLESEFQPQGDQPEAIDRLTEGVKLGKRSQVLLGITGSGKTFTMANVIANTGKPSLILAHNKTLAAQLYQEFKTLFPNNAVEYFVSYYDYYQPEAYIARTDTYIEKDLSINDRIEKLRLRATCSLLERDDVIIVSSVSCIYGLGMPEYFREMKLSLNVGESYRRDEVLLHLIELQYTRNDYELTRSHFRVRGDILEIVPAYEDDLGYRIEFFGDELERISEIDPLTGKVKRRVKGLSIYPGSHHVTPEEARLTAMETIKAELKERSTHFSNENLLVEQQRIEQRTRYDLEMIKEIGYCKGVENYSRHFSARNPGEPPSCLLDYFPSDFLLFIDESHQTLPQVRAMYNGDRARKKALIDFGFRLPSAYDNRPLKFEEFYNHIHQVVYVSATPSPWEINEAQGDVIQQIIRPTGLLDPTIEVRPATNQVDDCLDEIRIETEKGGRVLVTTLTKKLSEDLSKYLKEIGVKAKYLHSDIDTLERVQIIKDLRKGVFDVLVGINLLREGLDIPEVSLVAILDADKEGFLRSETSLIQTCGRAARNSEGRVIMYADKETQSIQSTLRITAERRKIQEEHNRAHGITPKTVRKELAEDLSEAFHEYKAAEGEKEDKPTPLDPKEIRDRMAACEKEMKQAAKELRFEDAARFRDLMTYYKDLQMLEDNPM